MLPLAEWSQIHHGNIMMVVLAAADGEALNLICRTSISITYPSPSSSHKRRRAWR